MAIHTDFEPVQDDWVPIEFINMSSGSKFKLALAIKKGWISDEDLANFSAWIKTNPKAPPNEDWYHPLGPLGHSYVVGFGPHLKNFLPPEMSPWGKRIAAVESNESLISLLEPEWQGRTGPEKEKKLAPTVSVFISKYGSYRFVKFDDAGKPIAAIQVMSDDKRKPAIVANAYVLPEHRQQGISKELLYYVREMFKKGLRFNKDRSEQGQAFVERVAKDKEAASNEIIVYRGDQHGKPIPSRDRYFTADETYAAKYGEVTAGKLDVSNFFDTRKPEHLAILEALNKRQDRGVIPDHSGLPVYSDAGGLKEMLIGAGYYQFDGLVLNESVPGFGQGGVSYDLFGGKSGYTEMAGEVKTAAPAAIFINDKVGSLRVNVDVDRNQSQITFDVSKLKKQGGFSPVGFLTVNDFGDGDASVFKVSVNEAFRQQGVGQALYLYAMGYLKERGFKRLTSDVSHSMTDGSEALWNSLRRSYDVNISDEFHEPTYSIDLTTFKARTAALLAKEAAPRGIWYHGTATKNLGSILSQGLIPVVKEKNWKNDENDGTHAPSRESYGGIYVTDNLMTATGSPRSKREGSIVLVCMELQPNTFYLDEDDINSTLNNALQHVSDIRSWVLGAYLALKFPDKVDKWRGADIDKFRSKYVEDAMRSFDRLAQEKLGEPLNKQLRERVVAMLPGMWEAALTRLAAQSVKQRAGDDSGNRYIEYDFKKAYGELFEGAEWENIPIANTIVPTVAEGERIFREASERLTRTMRLLARPEAGRFRNTARVNAPIGYSGSNHIVAVLELHDYEKRDDGGYVTPITVHYGTIPEDFLRQHKERMGGEIEVTKRNGRRDAPEAKEAAGQRTPLHTALLELRPQFAAAAQSVYDAWEQDESGFDEELGEGGICTQVCQEMMSTAYNGLVEDFPDVETEEGGQDGDDHSWLIVTAAGEAYGVDISPGVYETGGGYSWKKRKDVTIRPEFVDVFEVPYEGRAKEASIEKISAEEDWLAAPPTLDELIGDLGIQHFNGLSEAAIRRKYDALMKLYHGGTLTVYRAIAAPDINTINAEGFGTFWSWHEAGAVAYYPATEGEAVYVFRANVNKNDVDWYQTCSMLANSEREIRINEGVQVQITGWRGGGEKEWQAPPPALKMVTASRKSV